MAPGLASLTVYVFSDGHDAALLSAIVSHDPLPATISDSWYGDDSPAPLEPYFKQMAAQGQSFFAASGDNAKSWSLSAGSVAGYAEDPWVTAVGGTILKTTKWRCLGIRSGVDESAGGVSRTCLPFLPGNNFLVSSTERTRVQPSIEMVPMWWRTKHHSTLVPTQVAGEITEARVLPLRCGLAKCLPLSTSKEPPLAVIPLGSSTQRSMRKSHLELWHQFSRHHQRNVGELLGHHSL